MADRTLQIYEDLKTQREIARKKYFDDHRKWRHEVAELGKDDKRPAEPVYEGPEEWELSIAEKRVKVRQWQLEARHEKFRRKQEVEHKETRSVYNEINVRDARTPEEGMRAYAKTDRIEAGLGCCIKSNGRKITQRLQSGGAAVLSNTPRIGPCLKKLRLRTARTP